MESQRRLDPAEIGRRIAARRDQLRLDQEQLADRAGVSRPYISRLERGIVPNPKVFDLQSVADALDLTLTELVRPADLGRREIRIAECEDIMTALADEPPEVAETVLAWFRQSVELAKIARLARPG